MLDDQVRALGRDHRDTRTTRSYVAIWLGQSGRLRSRPGSFVGSWTTRPWVLGPGHPTTRTTRNLLAQMEEVAKERGTTWLGVQPPL